MSELTLGGYMAKHERAAAFGGSDGQAYSVAIYVDEEPDLRGLYGAALLFVRWSRSGDRPVGHVESETLAWGHTEDEAADAWVKQYQAKYNMVPSDYSITAYDAALVIADAVKRLIADTKDVTREAVRDYIQTARVKTFQGTIAFDANGDLQDRTISVFQIKKDVTYSADDMVHQYHYIGVAPQT